MTQEESYNMMWDRNCTEVVNCEQSGANFKTVSFFSSFIKDFWALIFQTLKTFMDFNWKILRYEIGPEEAQTQSSFMYKT